MSFTDQMADLRASLDENKKRTNQAVRKVKRDANEITRGAQELVAGYAQTQKANAQQLHKDLKHTAQNLVRDVKEARGANIKEQRERRREFAQAQIAFWGKQKPEEKKKEKEEKEE